MFSPISVQLLPTFGKEDLLVDAKLLLTPWRWRDGPALGKLESWFKNKFNYPFAYAFNSGRSAEYAILKSLGIGRGDEVLVQAFTCVAVPNSVIWAGARPVYVDIEEGRYTMSVSDLKQKITKRSKAIIIQHTFGFPDQVEEIKKIAKKNQLYLLEDCAHSLGNQLNGKLIGSFGDAAFFSFGRDKVVSSVFGGIAITANEELGKNLKTFVRSLSKPSYWWIGQQLFYPLALSLILPTYRIYLGKVMLYILQKIKILSKPVARDEYCGFQPSNYPQKQANALALLALLQLKKLALFQKKRITSAQLYRQHLKNLPIQLPSPTDQPLIRFPIAVSQPNDLVEAAKKEGIVLGRWYSNIIDPLGTDLKQIGYQLGSCPNAERAAKRVVNLPTSPMLKKKQIMKVINFLKRYYSYKGPSENH